MWVSAHILSELDIGSLECYKKICQESHRFTLYNKNAYSRLLIKNIKQEANSISANSIRSNAIREIVKVEAKFDIPSAKETANLISDQVPKFHALLNIAVAEGKNDFVAAKQLADSFPAGTSRSRVLLQIVEAEVNLILLQQKIQPTVFRMNLVNSKLF